MKWISIEEMVKELNLDIDLSDKTDIKSEIRKQLSLIHPDKNNGQFSSDSAKERFNKLTLALEYLEEQKSESQSLILRNQFLAIIHAINDAFSPFKEEALGRARAECHNAYKLARKKKYILPRLSSGIFAACCGFIITFAEQLKTHPFLTYSRLERCSAAEFYLRESVKPESYETLQKASEICADARMKSILPILLFLFFLSSLFFLLTWVSERVDNARSEWLLSEEGLRTILRQVLLKKCDDQEIEDKIKFTKRDLESEIIRYYTFKTKVRSSLAEKTAKLYIEELSNRDIIKRVKSTSLDAIYTVKKAILNDLTKGENKLGQRA